jgi:hypothetical protein
MEEGYWDRFTETGSVKDYLSYKMSEPNYPAGQKKENSMGVGSCESNCTDRNGAVYSARW